MSRVYRCAICEAEVYIGEHHPASLVPPGGWAVAQRKPLGMLDGSPHICPGAMPSREDALEWERMIRASYGRVKGFVLLDGDGSVERSADGGHWPSPPEQREKGVHEL